MHKFICSAILLKSDWTSNEGIPIFSFMDQDKEIETGENNYVKTLLQSLCDLFVIEYGCIPEESSTSARNKMQKKPYSYEHSNGYYFVCSLLNLSYPNQNQNEILISLSNTYDVDLVTPNTTTNAFHLSKTAVAESKLSSKLAPYSYVISCTMLRLLGHLYELQCEGIAQILIGANNSDNKLVACSLASWFKFKAHLLDGLQGTHDYMHKLIDQFLHPPSIVSPAVMGKYTPTNCFFGVEQSTTLDSDNSYPISSMNEYLWIIMASLNHQICRIVRADMDCNLLLNCAESKVNMKLQVQNETIITLQKIVSYLSNSFATYFECSSSILSSLAVVSPSDSMFHNY